MSAPFDLPALVDFYVERLIYIYRTQPNARATIGILLKQAVADGMANMLNESFDLETAVGPQLDIIGKYAGVIRQVADVLDQPYFGFVEPDGSGNHNGMTDSVSSINFGVIFFDAEYIGQSNTMMNDTQMRFAIKLKIILNHSDGTLASLMSFIQIFFTYTISLTDNRDMTLTYLVAELAPLPAGILATFLPKPMGVGLNVVEVGNRITDDGTLRITDDGQERVISI